jgi:TonB-dependent receptor
MNHSVQSAYLRRAIHAICIGGATTLSLNALAAETNATESPPASSSDSDLSEITVTGYRASIQESLDIKRNSDGIVDAISAEDIGKFPDANLATAMERIPGVTVSRAAVALTGTGGTSSAGGSTQITVRGFGPQFNETLFDGRSVPTAIGNTNRGFDFGSVGSDFVGQLDVLKTPDSSLSSGSIGATINIKYPKPFDHPGLNLVGTLSGDDNTGQNTAKPNGGFLISDTFADDRFGILFDAAAADSVVRGNHVNIQGWEGGNPGAGGGLAACQLAGAAPCATAPGSATNPTTIKDFFIQDYGIYQEHTEDKRIGARLALQARPVDGVEITVDDNFSRESLVQQQYGFSAWFNNGALTDVTLAPDGTVTNFTQPGTPTDFQAQINQAVIVTNTAGLNVKWDESEHTSFIGRP